MGRGWYGPSKRMVLTDMAESYGSTESTLNRNNREVTESPSLTGEAAFDLGLQRQMGMCKMRRMMVCQAVLTSMFRKEKLAD